MDRQMKEPLKNTETDSKDSSKNLKLSETLIVGILLTIVGGFLDAYTYLFRGKVFANGQTGNLVLLGIFFSQQDFRRASYYLLPIAAFLLGVFLAEGIHLRIGNDNVIKWRHIILLLEILILIASIFVPSGELDYLVNISISFVCALQTQAFRSLHGLSYISVMCTGNMRSGVHEIFHYIQTHNRSHLFNSLRYFAIIFSFIIGAVLGTFFTDAMQNRSLLIPIFLLSAVLLLLFFKKHFISIAERYHLTWLNR